MADPVSQIFAQAQAGSAQGQSFAAPFERGMSFASRRREFEREMSMKERSFQAQEQSMLLENKLNQIKIGEFERTIRDREASLGAYKELSDLVESNVKAGNAADPKVSFQIFGILAKNPALAESPRAQSLLKTFNDSVQLTLKQKEIENQATAIQSREDIADARNQAQFDATMARIQAQSEMLEFKLRHGAGFTPGSLEKDILFIDSLQGYTAEEKKKIKDTRLFLEGKPGVEREKPSRADYIARRIAGFEKTSPTKTVVKPGWFGGKKEEPMNQKEMEDFLGEQYDRIYGAEKSSGQPAQGTKENPFRPTSIQDMNAIPPGGIYINPKDGRTYIKGAG